MNIKTTLVRICFLVIVIMYLIMGTGLHGDDYSEIVRWKSQGFFDFLGISGFQLFFFGSYYVFWWAYPLLGFEHQWVYDLMKVVSHMLSLFCVYRFAIDYLPRDRAMLASAVFVFYPLHDTTMYWYMTAPYIFFPAVTMLAHAMIRNDRLVFGLLLAFIGAFAGYFSPPYLFGLAAVFLMERQLKKAALFVFPGVLYVTYYFYIKFAYSGLEQRINSSLTVADYLKQLVLQPFSFIDAAVGPSYWLKVYYAIGSIGLASGLFVLCIVVFLFIKVPFFSKRPDFPRYLVGGLFCIVGLSFGMFALTGLYQNSALNLGNRTTVYGSLLIAFLLALLPLNKKTVVIFALIFILPVFGLSDYWKSWNVHQKQIIANIHTNASLKALEPESTLLVTGNIYSKLGQFSHIEFFSMPWVVNAIFHGWVKSKSVVALAPYIELDNNSLVDPKFGGRYPLGSKLYLYNSEANTVSPIALGAVPQLLTNRPRELRHWVQLAKGTWVESSITYMSPRLAYLFQ